MSIAMQALRAIVIAVLGAALAAGCSGGPAALGSIPPEKFPEHANRMSHALVAGDAAALAMFNDQLMQIEGVSKPEDAYILCLQCTQLAGGGTPPASLDYYYPTEHSAKPGKFLQAWTAVRETAAGRKVALTLDQDTGGIPPGACPLSPPAPVCYSAAWCPSSCDKDRNMSGCQKCE